MSRRTLPRSVPLPQLDLVKGLARIALAGQLETEIQ
jgi:hypothetical protein